MAIVKNDWIGAITGSVYTTASSDAIKPPTGKVFIAITILTADTTFDASAGLISEKRVNNTISSSVTNNVYIGTDAAAHDLAAGSETVDEGSGGLVVDSVDFPVGITLYGRWTEIDVADGAIVAYIGD